MAQHDYNIANQSFPSFRTDLNNVLSAINTSNSGTSRPSGAVAGTIWLDTTSATTPTLKFYDGADDISLATFDYSANTVNWLDSTVSADLVNDLSPQLGGMLDVNGNAIGNGTEELIKFSETASAVNEVTVTNSATGNAPEISATGDDTNIDFKLTPKGTGKLILDGLNFPTADGTTGQFLKTDGSGNLSFDDAGGGDWIKIASSDATSVSSIEFQDIFTTDYRHYRIIGADINPNNDQLVFQFLTSGSTAITTGYYSGGTEVMINSSTSASSVVRRWNGDDINLVDQNTGTDLTRIAWFDMTLVNPTDSASYRSGTFLSGVYSSNAQIYNYHKSFLNTNTGSSYGGIKFQGNGSQTINHAKITIYGVK